MMFQRCKNRIQLTDFFSSSQVKQNFLHCPNAALNIFFLTKLANRIIKGHRIIFCEPSAVVFLHYIFSYYHKYLRFL